MSRWLAQVSGLLGIAIAAAGCVTSEGDVFTSLGNDGAVDGPSNDADPCALAGPCPEPEPGDVTICGRVVDLETSQPVTGGEPDVRVFDLADLRQHPDNADELAVVAPDQCGWFTTTIRGVLDQTVIHTGELLGGGDFQRAVSLIEAPPGQRVQTTAFVLRDQTNQTWSNQAGLVGASFADLGSVLPIYIDLNQAGAGPFQGGPAAGVAVMVDGAPATAGDYYFTDTDPLVRSVVDPALAVTGLDGAALLLSPLGTMDIGGQKDGCDFEQAFAVSLPTMVQVQEILGHCD